MSSEGSGTRVSSDGTSRVSGGQASITSHVSGGQASTTSAPQRRWTFFHHLKKQKHGLSHMALLAACCFLSFRVLEQKREMERLKLQRDGWEELREREERRLRRRMDSLRRIVLEEIRGANASESLQRRVQELFSAEDNTADSTTSAINHNNKNNNNNGSEHHSEAEESRKGKFMV